MSKAIRIHAFGGPDVLTYEDVSVGEPGPGQILIKQTAIGINFIDVYQRTGLYPLPLPFIAGNEAAGVVEAIGLDVTDIKVGDRVAYATSIGSYADDAEVFFRIELYIPKIFARTCNKKMLPSESRDCFTDWQYPAGTQRVRIRHKILGEKSKADVAAVSFVPPFEPHV